MDKFTKTTEIDISAMNDMEDETPKKSSAGKIIAMILCLIFAIIIWFLVMELDSTSQERKFEGISVELIGSEGYMIQGDLTIDVVFNGTNKNLANIDANDIKATLDLSKTDIDTTGKEMEYIVSISLLDDTIANVESLEAKISLKITEK